MEIDLDFLFVLARLEQTAESNKKYIARKLLRNKLQKFMRRRNYFMCSRKVER